MRRYSTSYAWAIARAIAGRDLHRNTFTQWRGWAKIPARARTMTFEQLSTVAAIAVLRSESDAELRRADVVRVQSEISDDLRDQIARLDALEIVSGRDAIAAIGLRFSAVKRIIPWFRLDGIYCLDLIRAELSS